MCGIVGYKSNHNIDHNILSNMNNAMINRGPDASGYYHDEEYNGAMRRLSINDLNNGNQPLYNSNKNVVLFYNGEIYNYKFLRNLLESKGYKFRTRSDGEVICHLYDEYNTELFSMLDGMFAVSLWLRDEKKLILARDIAGEKPLYYYQLSQSEIVYGSTLKSIYQFPNLKLSLNMKSIWDLPTFTWTPQPETIFNEIKAVPNSSYMIIDKNKTEIYDYNYKYNKDYSNLSDTDLIEVTRNLIKESVELRLLSDVPVGSFLSGGLDSSIVAYIASKKIPNLSTYTIGFEQVEDLQHGQADESNLAEEFASKINSKHKTIKVTSRGFMNDLSNFVKFSDQPLAIPSGLGIMSVAKQAREDGIKVLLSGDCADECFGGYSWYQYLSNQKKNPSIELGEDVSFHNYGYPLENRLLKIKSYKSHKQAWAWHYYASELQKKTIFSRNVFDQSKSSLRHFENFNKNNYWKEETFVAQDRDFYLKNEMLQKLDRMTMAHSVEGRVPFAAPSILNLSSQLNYSHFYRDKKLKWVLKEAFRNEIPNEILDRPKHRFNVPLDHWFKNDWSKLIRNTFSLNSCLYQEGIIKKESLNNILELQKDEKSLNSPTIFSFIVLELWLKEKSQWKL